jgi:hypothetical protein
MDNLRRASIVVAGADLYERFGLRLTSGSTFAPPTPKEYTVDIPAATASSTSRKPSRAMWSTSSAR